MLVSLLSFFFLAAESVALLEKCGIQDDIFGLDFIFNRDDDIPGLIEMGGCDLEIIGQNLLVEYYGNNQHSINTLKIIMFLNFSRCRLSIAIPKEQAYKTIDDLQGKHIATSYPHALGNFLIQQGVNDKIITMHGSVELMSQIGIADLIDLMLHINRDKLLMLAQILPGSESPTILELQGMPDKVPLV